MKRLFDIGVSALGLIITAPLYVAIAGVILVTSGRPILFAQERIGRGFRPFLLYKFRSMRAAEPGLDVTAAGDNRITPIGRILRQAKLDELPQLWNVLRGDMSLVGPRPEVRRYVQLFRDRYKTLLTVRPGLTDPATLRFRNEEKLLAASPDPVAFYRRQVLPAKLALAEDYLHNRSFRTDLVVLFATARKLFEW